MSTNANRFCPNCGSPADPLQRFCANCGSAIDATTASPLPTALKLGSSTPDLAASPTEERTGPTQVSGSPTPIPPPPPPQANGFQSSTNYQTPQIPQTPQGVPDFARPQKGAASRRGGRLLLLILVLVVVVGAIAATFYYVRGKNSSSTPGSGASQGSSSTTTTGTDATTIPSAGTVTFSPALSFIYADVQVSILDVKQAGSFADDTGIYGSPGVLRLDVKEASQPIDTGYYNYSYTAFTLVKADGTTITESSSQTSASISAGVSRSNWLDFTTNGNVDVSKLTLRVGAATEAQMNIPLQNNADLNKYQPKTYNINQKAPSQYGYVTWTITTVTMSYSALGSQAKTGMVYVVISSRLDDNSSTNSYDSVGTYMRLQTGDTSAAPENNTLPGSVAANQTNVTGNTVFEVPQGSTNFTCTVASNGPGTTTVSIQFQLH